MFTILVLRAIYKDPISVIMSYPPSIVKRVEELPQYKDTIKRLVNFYDFLVLDWGHFCHSKKVRIPGTEDMVKEYETPWFHLKGTCKGTVFGVIVALLSGGLVHFLVR